MIDLSY